MKGDILLEYRLPATLFFKIILTTVITVLGICIFSMLLIEPNIPSISSYFTITSQSPKFVSDRLLLIVSKFDLDSENSVPAYISTLNLIVSAVLLYTISSRKRDINDKQWKKWRTLSIIFVLLSMDESVSFHEIGSASLNIVLHLGVNHYGTVVLGIVIGGLLLYYYLDFILELPKLTKVLFVLSGLIFVIGAIFVEGIGGYILKYTPDRMLYNYFVIIEESMEMLGVVLFLYALLNYMTGFIYKADGQKPYYKLQSFNLQ